MAYHILSKHRPAGNFRAGEAIDALSLRKDEETILKRMLNANRAGRYRASFDLITDLQRAVQPEKASDIYSVVMSKRALRQLAAAGVSDDDPGRVVEWVIDQLGEKGKRPVPFS